MLAIVLPVLAGACVATDATKPLVPSTLDQALADVAHPALDWSSTFFSGVGVVTLPIVPARCPFDQASQFFICAPLGGGGLTLNQRFTLLDASGAKQSAFDATTTRSLHLENAVAGTWAPASLYQPGDTSFVDGQQVLDLTGLGTSRHTLNGTSFTLSTFKTPTGATPREAKATITDLVLPVVASGAPVAWPLSGTIDTRSRDFLVGGDTTVFIATMRFSGSSIVTLTITQPGGIATCQLNLVTAPGLGCGASPSVPVGADLLP